MSKKVKIDGIDKVTKNLNKALSKIKNGSLAGMIEASIVIRRSMEAESPKVPVDTGNLRASWFVVTSKGSSPDGRSNEFKGADAGELAEQHQTTMAEEKSAIKGSKPAISMGFTANYAAPVHEMQGANFNRPGSGAKFFESALKRNKKTILKLMQKKAKV